MKFVVIAAVLVAMLAANVEGQCRSSSSSCPVQACGSGYFINALNLELGKTSPSNTLLTSIYQQYAGCTTHGASGSELCCDDPCNAHTTTLACAADANCIPFPLVSGGSAGNPATCTRKEKLCGLLPMVGGCGTAGDQTYGFCQMVGADCVYVNPAGSGGGDATFAPGEGVDGKCAALHPMVIAMLALMFVTLVGAIIFVGVIVVINQKRADKEEQEREAEALRKGRR